MYPSPSQGLQDYEVCTIAKVHRDRMREALMCAQSKLTSAIGDKDKMVEQVETSKENATLHKPSL